MEGEISQDVCLEMSGRRRKLIFFSFFPLVVNGLLSSTLLLSLSLLLLSVYPPPTPQPGLSTWDFPVDWL